MVSRLDYSQQKRVALALALFLGLLILLSFTPGPLRRSQGGLGGRGDFTPSLLLNSGLSSSEQAKARIIFWLPQMPETAWLEKLPRGWNWTEHSSKRLVNGPVTVAGSILINRQEERGLLGLYQSLAGSAAQQGGQAYLDERISEPVDIFRYFAALRLLPRQWAYSGTTFSLAGYWMGPITPVQAGPDPINLQLLTRSHAGQGETVLAIPALLEEF